MRRSLAFVALLLSLLPAAALAEGRISPLAVAADVVDGDPSINTRDFQGHKAWSILWSRDARGRELHLGYIEGLDLPYRRYPQEMVALARDKSSPDPADERLEFVGRAERIWDRDVFWLVTSELAVMAPDPKKPETTKDGQLHRGQDRRTCAVFTTDPAPRTGTVIGWFCRDLPPGFAIDEATARQWLEDLDLTIVGGQTGN